MDTKCNIYLLLNKECAVDERDDTYRLHGHKVCTTDSLLIYMRNILYLNQWSSGKFGTVGTRRSPLPLLSPLFLSPLPVSPFLSPTLPLPYLVAVISMIFLRINLP